MQEISNVLRILRETKEAIKREDVIVLRELSNQTIHTASTTQDPDNVAIAVIIYSLGKIIERRQENKGKKYLKICDKIIYLIDKIIESLNNHNELKAREYLNLIRKKINRFSDKYKEYIKDVFQKASINKASKIYEHGISMERTASLLGITMFDLASYSGQKGVTDVPESKGISVKSRIKLAMEMFE